MSGASVSVNLLRNYFYTFVTFTSKLALIWLTHLQLQTKLVS